MKRLTLLPLYLTLAATFLVAAARLVQMQIIDGNIYDVLAKGNSIRTVSTQPARGVIYDRNMLQLVSNRPAYAVAITPADLPAGTAAQAAIFARLAGMLGTSPVVTAIPSELFAAESSASATIAALAGVLKMPLDKLQATLNQARQTSPEAPNLLLEDVDAATVAAIQGHAADWPGVQVMDELQYTFITRRDQPYNPVIVKDDVPYDTMQLIEEAHSQMPGVSVVAQPVRLYDLSSYLGHILGYMGAIPLDQYNAALPAEGSGEAPVYSKDDKVGLAGVEASMEAVLRGQKGERVIEVDANQREVRQLSEVPASNGANVVLTIDSALQISVTKALQQGIDAAHKTKPANNGATGGGVAVVENVKSGAILALVSLPSYDDNLFASGISQADLDALNDDPNLPLFDRAISGQYPPGSTFKLITAAASLQERVVTTATRLYDGGYVDVPLAYDESQRTRFKGWKATGLGWLNIEQAIQQSCDICFYELAGPRQEDVTGQLTHYYDPKDPTPHYFSGLGIDRLHQYMTAFGFGMPTGIELPGEAAGVAADQSWKLANFPGDNWSLGDTLYTGIGQGFTLATPLQLTNMTAAVANGGTLYKPQLVGEVLDSDGGTVKQSFQPQVIRKLPVDPAYLAVIRAGMRMAVGDPAKGTAYKTELRGVQIAGKTGTAEIGEPIDSVGHRRAHAWFTAFAPYDDPQIAVTVLIEAGDESLEGSTYAVPVARSIFEAYFHLENEH